MLLAASFIAPLLAMAFGIGLALFMFWRNNQLEIARTAAMESLARALEMPFLAQDSYGLAKVSTFSGASALRGLAKAK
jgi:hypothetical protein